MVRKETEVMELLKPSPSIIIDFIDAPENEVVSLGSLESHVRACPDIYGDRWDSSYVLAVCGSKLDTPLLPSFWDFRAFDKLVEAL